MAIAARESNRMLKAVLAFVVICFGAALKSIQAQNLVQNPSAEEVDATGLPVGWGKYAGCGQARLTASTAEKHTGLQSACLEMTGWWTPQTNPAAQQANNAIVLCPNNGYSAAGSISCSPDADYAFTFWYKGDFQSASVSAVGWPGSNSTSAECITLSVTGSAMNPTQAWQRCSGTFHSPTNVSQFALMIRLTAQRTVGENLGTIYVDDAYIRKKTIPDGQIRGVWWYLKASTRDAGLREMADSFSQIRGAGLNSVFVWVNSLYLAALGRPELLTNAPQAAWDAVGEILKTANTNSLQVHAWFSPWINKENYRGIELRDHPEWAAMDLNGVTNTGGVCFMRPEVRQFELDLIAKLLDRYPDLAGVHLEEPGFSSGSYCYCSFCQQLASNWYGLDIRANAAAFGPARENLAASMCTDFVVRLRQPLKANWPWVCLSANGSGGSSAIGPAGEWRIGRDWATWARRGSLDFYVPQLYTTNTGRFVSLGTQTLQSLGSCGLATGIGISWSGIYPSLQDPATVKAQIRASQQLGANGFVLFDSGYLTPEILAAVAEALQPALPLAPANLRILSTNQPSTKSR